MNIFLYLLFIFFIADKYDNYMIWTTKSVNLAWACLTKNEDIHIRESQRKLHRTHKGQYLGSGDQFLMQFWCSKVIIEMVNTVTQGRLLRKRKSSPHGHYICNYVMSQFDTSEFTSLIQQKKKPLHFNQSQQRTFQLYVSVVGPKAPLTLRKTCWYIFYKLSSKNHSRPSLQFYDDFIIRHLLQLL